MLFSSESGCKPEGREESEREELPILIETEKQVTIAKGVHPVPCRTRKLSPSAPMVLRFASRESRSLPVPLLSFHVFMAASERSFFIVQTFCPSIADLRFEDHEHYRSITVVLFFCFLGKIAEVQ